MSIFNMKKLSVLLVCLALLFTCTPMYASAESCFDTREEQIHKVVEIEGPSVYVDLGEYGSATLAVSSEGTVSGEIIPRSGKTAVTLMLTGYINDIQNYFEIGVKWSGTNQVNYISADELSIKKNFFSAELYGLPFYVPAGSTVKGYYPIGYIIIDPNITSVNVKTKNLMCFFNNEDVWIRLNEISGKIVLNDF